MPKSGKWQRVIFGNNNWISIQHWACHAATNKLYLSHSRSLLLFTFTFFLCPSVCLTLSSLFHSSFFRLCFLDSVSFFTPVFTGCVFPHTVSWLKSFFSALKQFFPFFSVANRKKKEKRKITFSLEVDKAFGCQPAFKSST